MCGYLQFDEKQAQLFKQNLRSELVAKHLPNTHKAYYPAFGQDLSKTINIVIEEHGVIKTVDAIWWFDCAIQNGEVCIGSRTTFNARNLDSPYWSSALKRSRGFVIATALGESKLVGKTKHQFYMQSKLPFVLGVLYKKLRNGTYCCAVITRDAHQKMAPYHEKAFPCFLPNDDKFLALWLSKEEYHQDIERLLNEPVLYPTLRVTRVKSYKGQIPYPSFEPVTLKSDI